MKNIILLLFLFTAFRAFPVTRFFDTWTTDDANQDLILTPTGTGAVRTSNDIEMRFYDSLGSYIGLKSSGVTADQTYILPPTDGSGGDILSTDGAGNLSFIAPLTLSGGTPGAVMFLGASSELTEDPLSFFWDSTLNKLSLGTDTAIGKLTLVGGGSTNSMVDVYAYAGNPAFHSTIRMRRANGTEAAPSRTQVNEDIGSIEFDAHNGSNFVQSSAIEVSSVEDFSAVKGSTKMEFFVSPSGPTYKQLSLTLNPDQTADFTESVGVPRIIVTSTTEGSRPCPPMTEVQRDAIIGPSASDCIFNTDSLALNIYTGATWSEAGGGIGDATTGIKDGGLLSIGAPTTTFTISDGNGIVTDSHTDPNVPVVTEVSWTGLTNVAATNLAGIFTSIGIDSTGSIIQKPDAVFTLSELRDTILIGTLVHVGAVVESISERKRLAFGGKHDVFDLADAIGMINKSGNVYGANGANLNLNKSAGSTYSLGSNYFNTKKDPSTLTDASQTALTFNYNYQNGGGGFTIVSSLTAIDPGSWDDGTGVLNTVNANNWSIQRIFYANTTTDNIIQYGQEEYNTIGAAIDGIIGESFNTNPSLAGATFRAYLIVRGGAADLSDSADARFIELDKFGQTAIGGAGASDLSMQGGYDASTQPQIVLDATRNGIQYRDALAPLGVSLFVVEDNAGTTEFFDVAAAGTTIGPQLDVDNLRLDGNVLSSTDVNGDITLNPNGTGGVRIDGHVTASRPFFTDTNGDMSTSAGFTFDDASDTLNVLAGQFNLDDLRLDGNTISTTSGNIDIDLDPAGTGDTNINSGHLNIFTENELRLEDAAGSDYIGFKAPTAITASTTFTLPDGDGEADQLLSTDGSAVLSWKRDNATTDIIYIDDLEGDTAPFGTTSGNNSSFDNGGVFAGTIATETVSPINGGTSYSYTQAAGSLDDWVKSEAITVGKKEQSNSVWLTFWYTYDGNNDDIKMVAYDSTNSNEVGSNIALIQQAATSTYFEMEVPILSNTASISWGHHTKVLNNGAEFHIDDFEISHKSKIKDTYNVEGWDTFTPTGSWTTNTTYTGWKKRRGKDLTVVVRMAMSGAPNAVTLTLDIPNSLTIDTDDINTDSSGLIEGLGSYFEAGVANNSSGIRVAYNSTTTVKPVSDNANFTQTTPLAAWSSGDELYFKYTVPISEWTDFSPNTVTTTNVPKTYTEAGGDFTVTGTSWTTTRASAIYYMSGDQHRLRYNLAGDRASGAGISSYTLTMSGVTFKNVANFYQPVTMSASNLSSDANIGHAFVNPNAGTITGIFSSNNILEFRSSGDVELESKPTWAGNVSGQVALTIPADQFQTKELTSVFSTNGAIITEITMSNMVPDRCYIYTLNSRATIDSGDSSLVLVIDNGSTELGVVHYSNADGTTDEDVTRNFTKTFIADGTTVTVTTSSLAAGSSINGSATPSPTWAQLTEKANCIETTKF